MVRSKIPLLIGMNLAVFALWNFAGPDSLPFMVQNFTISWVGLSQGYLWTLITSVFSHYMFFHFFLNMYVLFSFGLVLENTLGTGRFLRFYLVAGIISSLAHAILSASLMHSPETPALGASGAIAGLLIVFSLIYPREKILLLGIIPMPAWTAALLFVGIDLWGLTMQVRGAGTMIGHGAHLGGAMTGFLYYKFFIRKRRIRGPPFQITRADRPHVPFRDAR
jgi:membrane associated rhomboid family serine protease